LAEARGAAGDRYLLKLFRDFVFHQVGEDGAPLLEWGHIAEALAKLDAGLPEKARAARRAPPPLPLRGGALSVQAGPPWRGLLRLGRCAGAAVQPVVPIMRRRA